MTLALYFHASISKFLVEICEVLAPKDNLGRRIPRIFGFRFPKMEDFRGKRKRVMRFDYSPK